ncbi:hypothetical protein [Spongiivirga citrea]|uniref:PKD domain-containing protein n=1 Tax=Spongiivirga citrea TaxID=1481457 RepID=A0A6M0CIJ9_9FLAO|nr:hypothetical protein [Spongiivirga citrea]NER16773.1 hypothetical protein [Spongiivirga citrea]
MKTIFKLFLLVWLIPSICLSQDNGENPYNVDYQAEVNQMVNIPNSPEAAAFTKYGNTKVSLYSGTPDISVPLYTIQGRELNVPIALTYDASGVKVSQIATWAGLGWNLNVGGRVSRITNGLPDDYLQGAYTSIYNADVRQKINHFGSRNIYQEGNEWFDSVQEAQEYYEWLHQINQSFIDTQPDIYSVNAPGLSAHLVFDIKTNNLPRALNNPRIKIQILNSNLGYNHINGWIITNEDGTQYFFENVFEKTLSLGEDTSANGALVNEYASSWMLTKIISANKKDTFEFDYTTDAEVGYWLSEQNGSSASAAVTTTRNEVYNYPAADQTFSAGAGHYTLQKFLKSIKHNGTPLATISRGNRTDIDQAPTNTKLDGITIKDYKGNLIKQVDFNNNDYFNNHKTSSTDIRLKLNGITIKGRNNEKYQEYTFEYDSPNGLPSRNSFAQDYYGYYNGVNNNVLYPSYQYGEFSFGGANREPNFTEAKKGLLKRITYPTGGYSIFNFEGNQVVESVNTPITRNYAGAGINALTENNDALYQNEDGSWADDQYLPFAPKIVIKNFDIPESGYYTIKYFGNVNQQETEAHIIQRGVIDNTCYQSGGEWTCPNFPKFKSFGEFLSAPVEHKFWQSTAYYQGSKYFNAGVYSVMVVMDENNEVQGDYGSVSFTIERQETVAVDQTKDLGGIRIANIMDYTENGTFAQGKSYTYDNVKVNYKPSFVSLDVSYSGPSTSAAYGTVNSSIIRRGNIPRGDDPAFVYGNVIEKNINSNGNSIGYTSYTFSTDQAGMRPRNSPPYESNYFPSISGGQVNKVEVLNTNAELVSSSTTSYYEVPNFSVRGRVIVNNNDHGEKTIFLRQGSNGKLIADRLNNWACGEGYYGSFGSPITLNTECWEPRYFTHPEEYGYVAILAAHYSPLESRYTFASGAVGGQSLVVQKQYFKNTDTTFSETSQTSETVYDSSIGYLTRNVTTTDSKGDQIKQSFEYPKDHALVNNSNSDAVALHAQNKLNTVLKTVTEVKKSGSYTFTSLFEKEYAYSYIAQGITSPTSVISKKANEQGEDRINFTYYSNGNIKETKQVNGATSVYVWGYNDMYPVAKIDNATHSQLGGTGYNSAVLNNLASSDTQIRTEINKIRTGLPNAMITSYTYDPMIGMTSMTDPRGYTSYYKYDAFNRLSYIEDADGHILKKYNYNYDGQSTEGLAALNASLSLPGAALINDNSSLVANNSGGSGNYKHQWTINDQPLAHNNSTLDFVFEAPGENNVSYILTDLNTGLKKTVNGTVTVYQPLKTPTLTKDKTHIIKGSSVVFTTANVGGGSGSRSYEWYEGSTKLSSTNGSTLTHTLNNTGTIPVKFKVIDNNISGHSNEVSTTVSVYNPLNAPSVSANNTYVLKGTTISFGTGNIGGGSGNRSYKWYVNNTEQSATGTSFSYTPSTAGNYTIKFRVTDTTVPGHYKEGVRTVYAYEPLSTPNVGSNVTYLLKNGQVNFTASNIRGGSGNRRYEWFVKHNSGGYVKQTTTATSFNYNTPNTGTYTILFRVWDTRISGHYKDRTRVVYSYNPLNTPTVSSNKTYVVKGSPINFTTGNIGNGSGYRRYEWYVKQGSAGYVKQSVTGTSFTYAPPTNATYYVKFRVIDTRIANHYKEFAKVAYAYNSLSTPNLFADKTYILEGKTISFTTNGIGGGSGYRRYEWFWRRNGSSWTKESTTATSLNKSFSTDGTYVIKFRVWDTRTNQYVDRDRTVYVYNPLGGGISAPSTVTVNNNASFNMGITGGSGVFTYSWNITTPWKTYTNTSKSFTLKMNYDYYGTRTVRCTVRDSRTGDSRTVTKSITTNGAPTLGGTLSKSNINVNTNYEQYRITAVPKSGSGHYTYKWYFGKSTSVVSTATNVSIYLDCSTLKKKVTCDIKDTRTGQTKTVYATYYFSGNCNSGGDQY